MPGEQGGGAEPGPCVGRERVGKFLAGLSSPERRGETALPDRPAIKGRSILKKLTARFPPPNKCTSHLGFSLDNGLAGHRLLICAQMFYSMEL